MLSWPSSHRTRYRVDTALPMTSRISPSREGVPTCSDSTTIRSPTSALMLDLLLSFPSLYHGRTVRSNALRLHRASRRSEWGKVSVGTVALRSHAGSCSPRMRREDWDVNGRLEGYRFGRLVVDGEEETRDVIVLPDRVVRNWWRIDGHSLVMEDLEDVADDLPERLIVGTGADQRMRPDPALIRDLEKRGVNVEVLPTDRAVE